MVPVSGAQVVRSAGHTNKTSSPCSLRKPQSSVIRRVPWISASAPEPAPVTTRVDPTAGRGSKRWDQRRPPSRFHRGRRRTPRRRGLRPERKRYRCVARGTGSQADSYTSDGPYTRYGSDPADSVGDRPGASRSA
jgi:hypothetical protein